MLHTINDLRLLYRSHTCVIWVGWPDTEWISREPDCACVVEFCALLYVLVEGNVRKEQSLVSPQTLCKLCLCLDFSDLEEVWRQPWSRGVRSFVKGKYIEEGCSRWNRVAFQLFKPRAKFISYRKSLPWDEHHEVGQVTVEHCSSVLCELTHVVTARDCDKLCDCGEELVQSLW